MTWSTLSVRTERTREKLKTAALALADRLGSRASIVPTDEPAKVLILQLQQVGDSIIFTPTLRALRTRWPRCRIDILANRVSAQLYRRCPHVHSVFCADSWRTGKGGQRLSQLWPLLRKLRQERYDYVIADVTQQAFKYSLVAWLTGAPTRVGFNVGHRGFLHTVHVPFQADKPYVDCNLDIARIFGCREPSPNEEIVFAQQEVEYVDALLSDNGYCVGTPLVVIHPGSNWQSKTWYPERWAAVAEYAVSKHAFVLFVGTSSENERVEDVRMKMRAPSASVVGKTDLLQLAALLRRATAFVGTDSGPRNLAGAVGTPNITVMSAQEYTTRWMGVRRDEVVIRSSPRCRGCNFSTCAHRLCMRAIGSGLVISFLERYLLGAASLGSEPILRQVELASVDYRAVAASEDTDCATLRSLAKSLPVPA